MIYNSVKVSLITTILFFLPLLSISQQTSQDTAWFENFENPVNYSQIPAPSTCTTQWQRSRLKASSGNYSFLYSLDTASGGCNSLLESSDFNFLNPRPGDQIRISWEMYRETSSSSKKDSLGITLFDDATNLLIDTTVSRYGIQSGWTHFNFSVPFNVFTKNSTSDSYFLVLTGTSDDSQGNMFIDNLQIDKLYNLSGIRLLTPIGGEFYSTREPVEIKWQTHTGINNSDIAFSADNGETWNTIAQGINADKSTFTWQPKDTLNSQRCRIRVRESNNPGNQYISDSAFKVLTSKISEDFENKTNYNQTTPANCTQEWQRSNAKVYEGQYSFFYEGTNADQDCQATFRAGKVYHPNPEQGDLLKINFHIFRNSNSPNSLDNVGLKVEDKQGNLLKEKYAYRYTFIPPITAEGWHLFSLNLGYQSLTKAKSDSLVILFQANNKEGGDLFLDDIEIYQSLNLTSPRLLSPEGGESIPQDTTYTIQWLASDDLSKVNLEYSTDKGFNWDSIAKAINAQKLHYDWTVPQVSSEECLVKIEDTANTNKPSISDTVFTIYQPPKRLTIQNPADSTTFYLGDTLSIKWTSKQIQNVRLDYSIDNGENWQTIKNGINAQNDQYDWPIPKNIEVNELGKIRILSKDNDPVGDTIKALSFHPVLTLENPKEGETIKGKTDYKIKWENHKTNPVTLRYSSNGGESWETYKNDIDTNFYRWSVPDVNNQENIIKVKTLTYSDSSGFFTIEKSSGMKASHQPSYNIYPNPADRNLNVKLEAPSKYKAKLYDMTGKQVKSTNDFHSHINLDLSEIPQGVYMLIIRANKKTIAREKVIITHNQ